MLEPTDGAVDDVLGLGVVHVLVVDLAQHHHYQLKQVHLQNDHQMTAFKLFYNFKFLADILNFFYLIDQNRTDINIEIQVLNSH